MIPDAGKIMKHELATFIETTIARAVTAAKANDRTELAALEVETLGKIEGASEALARGWDDDFHRAFQALEKLASALRDYLAKGDSALFGRFIADVLRRRTSDFIGAAMRQLNAGDFASVAEVKCLADRIETVKRERDEFTATLPHGLTDPADFSLDDLLERLGAHVADAIARLESAEGGEQP